MPKLSITLAAAALSISFAPSAQAYNTEPGPQTLHQISQIAPLGPQSVKVEDVCTVEVTPILASILGLPDDWRGEQEHMAQTAMACADQ